MSGLPADFPAAIAIVQHLDPKASSLLSDILDRRTALRVKQTESGESLWAGMVYVARPDRHLLINSDATLSLTHTEPIHFARPAAELLFESLDQSCKQRGIAVVLTGTGKDGAMEIRAVKAMGGVTIVQDQKTAQFSRMPRAAIQTQAVDFVLPIGQIAPMLVKLVRMEEQQGI